MILMMGDSRLEYVVSMSTAKEFNHDGTHFFRRMFSGFRSQWISLALLSKHNPFSNC